MTREFPDMTPIDFFFYGNVFQQQQEILMLNVYLSLELKRVFNKTLWDYLSNITY